MYFKDVSKEKAVYEILDIIGLSEEDCKGSKRLKMERDLFINRSIKKMTREENCAKLNFISLSTYTRLLNEIKDKIEEHKNELFID